MYGPGPDIARLRIADEVRRADAYRLSRETRKGRASAEHARARAVGRTLLTALLWPIRH